MKTPFLHIFRNASEASLRCWLGKIYPDGLVAPAVGSRGRPRFVDRLVGEVRERGGDAAGRILVEAQRIVDLNDPAREWIVQRQVQRTRLEAELFGMTLLDRLVHILRLDIETFEDIEREAAFHHAFGRKQRHTRFQSVPGRSLSDDAELREKFRRTVMSLYRQHDGSGEDATFEAQTGWTESGHAFSLVSIEVERVPEAVLLFVGPGRTDNSVLKRACETQARYEPDTGCVDIVCDRGPKDLRRHMAEAFVADLLGIDVSPVELADPPLQLDNVVNMEKFDTDAEDGISDVFVSMVRGSHPDWPGKIITLEGDSGVHRADLERIFPGASTFFKVQSISFHVEFEEGLGRKKSNSKQLSFTVRADGSTTLDRSNKRHRLIRDKYLPMWKLEG